MSKNTLIKGTLILTITGFATRFMGIFYKIYLSKMIGAEMMGVYQLIFPVYGICFTLYGSGLQTSISRLIAAERGKNSSKNIKKILIIGLLFSVTIALTLSLLLYSRSEWVAARFLLEPRSASSLRILALVFPFCGITACINGYYYGIKNATVPATSQLLEQITRVLSVYIIATIMGRGNVAFTCELAVIGLVLGEVASNLYNIVCFFIESFKNKHPGGIYRSMDYLRMVKKENIAYNLLKLSIPLTSNRLLISILQSFEAVLIPNMLKQSGLSTAEALSIYGILTGMSIPFIMFPSTITNSFAVMLLPTVSEAQSASNERLIDITASSSLKYSIIIGILSTGIFIVFGNSLGTIIFANELAGKFLITLAWLCPFLYLTTTLGSIINGLGKTHLTFMNTIVGLAIRILFVFFVIPIKGISGYLIGMLISQLVISILDIIALTKNVRVYFNAVDCILKPGVIITFLGFLIMRLYEYFSAVLTIHPLMILMLSCGILCVGYIGLLFITKAITMKEFRP